jgi:hypothetical protein
VDGGHGAQSPAKTGVNALLLRAFAHPAEKYSTVPRRRFRLKKRSGLGKNAGAAVQRRSPACADCVNLSAGAPGI